MYPDWRENPAHQGPNPGFDTVMDMFTEAERNYRCYAQQKQMLEKLKLERPLTEGEEEDLQSMDPLILLRPVSITAVRLPIVACLTADMVQDCKKDRQKWKKLKKGDPTDTRKRHMGKIHLTRKGKKGNTLPCGHLNVEYFLVHKNLATTLRYILQPTPAPFCVGRFCVTLWVRVQRGARAGGAKYETGAA